MGRRIKIRFGTRDGIRVRVGRGGREVGVRVEIRLRNRGKGGRIGKRVRNLPRRVQPRPGVPARSPPQVSCSPWVGLLNNYKFICSSLHQLSNTSLAVSCVQ